MMVCEYAQKKNFNQLDTNAKVFTAKMIVREVKQIAQEKNIPEELAYKCYCMGLYGGDRKIGEIKKNVEGERK